MMTTTKMKNLEGLCRVCALQPDVSDGDAWGDGNANYERPISGNRPAFEEMAFTRQSDLIAYARGLTVPPEAIEKWISAGLLFPDEIRMAEKIIKILREKIKVS